MKLVHDETRAITLAPDSANIHTNHTIVEGIDSHEDMQPYMHLEGAEELTARAFPEYIPPVPKTECELAIEELEAATTIAQIRTATLRVFAAL